MKKITATILSAAALSSMWTASGQTVGDALRFSDNNYYGTARTIAKGNAFTALGGDLRSVVMNPAGSAVNSFSQVTITPGITISGSRAQYLAEPSLNDQYGSAYRNRSTNFTMPHVGVMINWDTRRRSGLKNVTFGFGLMSKQAAPSQSTKRPTAAETSSTTSGSAISSTKDTDARRAEASTTWCSTSASTFPTRYSSGPISASYPSTIR